MVKRKGDQSLELSNVSSTNNPKKKKSKTTVVKSTNKPAQKEPTPTPSSSVTAAPVAPPAAIPAIVPPVIAPVAPVGIPPAVPPLAPIHDQLANMMIQQNEMITRQNMERMIQSAEKFDGQKTQWKKFWNLADTRINPTTLDNIAKLEYVKKLLTGEAARIGNLYESTNANYRLMLQKLKNCWKIFVA
uniref:Uncharacterized protein n=1 Tax=Panagrolaimus sp. JU765 TaxID=591449 RepID=A0AC34R574_9BILA